MTWSDYKMVVSQLSESAFDLTEDEMADIAYEYLSTGGEIDEKKIEQFAMMKGAD